MADIKVPFNLLNPIPEHRLVKIYNADGLITPIPMIIDDDYSIKISSSFGELWEGSSNNLMTLVSSSFNLPSGQFALQGLQVWQKTEPIDLSFSVHIEMDTNPRTEVVDPIFELMGITVPSVAGEVAFDKEKGTFGGLNWKDITSNVAGALESFTKEYTGVKLKTLIPPGPNIQSIIKTMSNDQNANPLASGKNKQGVFNVKLGCFKFKNVIITQVDPKFSKEVCYIDNCPYPISADVSLGIRTMEVATTQMITQMTNNFNETSW